MSKMDNNEIMVSVCCLVYNHEKYLRQCLDGFVMQKTNFKYEVLIHDDASTDGSADIIREYERKYPDIIKPIYQNENQYSKKVRINWIYQYPRAKGKYIALCEGDDYWCDENKLQLQFDMMETCPEASMCVHKVNVVSENNEFQGRTVPLKSINHSIIKPEYMMKLLIELDMYPFQTSSYFVRIENINRMVSEQPKFVLAASVGDVPLMMYMVTCGPFVFIDKTMSCYRMGSVGSWNSRNRVTKEDCRIQYRYSIAWLILYDIHTSNQYHEYIQKMIDRDEFRVYQIDDDYDSILRKKYRWLLKNESKKQQLYYHIMGRFPFMKKIYQKVKRIDG